MTKKTPVAKKDSFDATLKIRLASSDRKKIVKAAAAAKEELSPFVRRVLLDACETTVSLTAIRRAKAPKRKAAK